MTSYQTRGPHSFTSSCVWPQTRLQTDRFSYNWEHVTLGVLQMSGIVISRSRVLGLHRSGQHWGACRFPSAPGGTSQICLKLSLHHWWDRVLMPVVWCGMCQNHMRTSQPSSPRWTLYDPKIFCASYTKLLITNWTSAETFWQFDGHFLHKRS
jgi:hypothetical protein